MNEDNKRLAEWAGWRWVVGLYKSYDPEWGHWVLPDGRQIGGDEWDRPIPPVNRLLYLPDFFKDLNACVKWFGKKVGFCLISGPEEKSKAVVFDEDEYPYEAEAIAVNHDEACATALCQAVLKMLQEAK